MFDNVDFKLNVMDAGGVDFLNETTQYFNVTGEHFFENGQVITGTLNNYKISVSQNQLKIKDGSLCKFYLGDNFQTLGRKDTKQAIEKLSDALHLSIKEAIVTRLDIAQNFILKHPVSVYLNHLGELKIGKRSMCAGSSLYYYQSKGLLIFYDKVKEQKEKGNTIPELFSNRNTLRYEQRYRQALNKTFEVEKVTGALLFDETFYKGVIDRWRDHYRKIKKINDINLNFEVMKGKKDLYTLGVLALAEMAGGEIELLNQIAEAQQSGYLEKKQAFDIRQAVKEACKLKEGVMIQNEVISELNKKVDEVSRFYR
jgi:hypothetical protein